MNSLWLIALGAVLLFYKKASSSPANTGADGVSPVNCNLTSETFSIMPNFPVEVARWRELAEQMGNSYNVPAPLVLAVIWQESNGNPQLIGDCGPSPSCGLMAVTEGAARDVGHTATVFQPCAQQCNPLDIDRTLYQARCLSQPIFEPSVNIQVGTGYLAWCKSRIGGRGWRVALWAYNWGLGNVQQVNYDESKIPASVRAYANRVIARANCGREIA